MKTNKFISTYFFYSTISFSSLKDVTKARTKLLKEKSVLEVLFHKSCYYIVSETGSLMQS